MPNREQAAQSETLRRECLTIREKTQPDAWRTYNPGAPGLLLAGYEGLMQREYTITAHGKVYLPGALDRLLELSTATNQPDDVKKWQVERAKYPEVAPPPLEKK